MTRLTDEMDAAAAQRAADMQEIQSGEAQQTTYQLYTYETIAGVFTCHLYGPPSTDQIALNNIGQDLHNKSTDDLAFMALPVEPLPEASS